MMMMINMVTERISDVMSHIFSQGKTLEARRTSQKLSQPQQQQHKK